MFVYYVFAKPYLMTLETMKAITATVNIFITQIYFVIFTETCLVNACDADQLAVTNLPQVKAMFNWCMYRLPTPTGWDRRRDSKDHQILSLVYKCNLHNFKTQQSSLMISSVIIF